MMKWSKPTAKTWIELLRGRAETSPEEIAVRFLANGDEETEILTFSELHQKALAIATTLQPLAEKGSRVVILLPNNVSFITAFFGCVYAGLVPVPGYPPRANRNKDRITKVLKQCGGRLIIGDSNVDRNQIMTTLSNLGFRGVRFVDFESIEGQATGWKDPGLSGDDLCFLQYTSGSTSDPKGVCLTHANLLSNMEMVQAGFGLHERTRIVSWLPLYHDMGLIGGILLSVYLGIPFTFMPPAAFVQKPLRWLRALTKYGATMAGGPNFTFDLCVSRFKAEELEGLDLSKIETFFNGAEPIRAATLDAFTSIYGRYGFKSSMYFPCYGLAEGSVFVTGGPQGSGAKTISISKSALQAGRVEFGGGELITLVGSGRVAKGLTLMIVDPQTLKEAAPNTVGEIWINGPSVSDGYWDNAKINGETFGIKAEGSGSSKGYLRTGDLGVVIDAELYVTGRIKDLLIVGGQNHYPQDLELTAQTKSGAAAIVAAFTLNENEQLAMLVEVGRTAMKADFNAEAMLIAQAVGSEHELAIHRIAFVRPGDLPRTSSGKVQRQLTKKRLLQNDFELLFDWTAAGASTVSSPGERPRSTPTPRSPGVDVAKLKEWLRTYAERRLNIHLAHARKNFAPHVVMDLGKVGLLGMLVPSKYGGLGLKQTEFTSLIEQLAAIDISLAIFVGLNNILGIQPLVSFGTEEQKQRLLPDLAQGRGLAAFAITEAGAGSNPKAIQSTAIESAAGLQITGEKIWIGLASWASCISVFVKEVNAAGTPVGISAFAIDPNQRGVSFGPESMTMGVQPIVQTPLLLDAVEVSDRDRLGEKGKGLVVANGAMNLARYGLLSVALGAMKRCYQIVEAYVSRRQINTGMMLENGLVLEKLTAMASAVEAVESLSQLVGRRLDAGQEVSEELYMICKIAGPELLWDVVDTSMQLCGGRGYLEANFLPEIMRDARLLRIFEGPTETLAYHLGALVIANGIESLKADVAAAETNAFEPLRAEITRPRGSGAEQPATKAYHLRACGLGELTALATLMACVPPKSPTAAWLGAKYRGRAADLVAQIDASGRTDADAVRAVAQRYLGQVGFVQPSLAGEDWAQNYTEKFAPAPVPVTVKVEVSSATALNSNPNVKVTVNESQDAAPVAAIPPMMPSAEERQSSTFHRAQTFIREKIATLRPNIKDRIQDNAPFATLGIDSISAIELALAIDEEFNVKVPDTLAWDYPTILEASTFVARLVDVEVS